MMPQSGPSRKTFNCGWTSSRRLRMRASSASLSRGSQIPATVSACTSLRRLRPCPSRVSTRQLTDGFSIRFRHLVEFLAVVMYIWRQSSSQTYAIREQSGLPPDSVARTQRSWSCSIFFMFSSVIDPSCMRCVLSRPSILCQIGAFVQNRNRRHPKVSRVQGPRFLLPYMGASCYQRDWRVNGYTAGKGKSSIESRGSTGLTAPFPVRGPIRIVRHPILLEGIFDERR
ncbi:hypothetical protein TRIP_B200707 [uncultured Desulfatiglans sp.]|nr:hypothetical protein TRIP_B200707 [uncultured Desulfatiglans sp.]